MDYSVWDAWLEEYAEVYARREIIKMYVSLVRRDLVPADFAAKELGISREELDQLIKDIIDQT